MSCVLTDRALNRALLARQHLLARTSPPPLEVVEHLVALQAQEPKDPYVALWARVEGFDPEPLGVALAERRVVRIALLRSTVHLVTAADCRALRPVLQPAMERHARSAFGRRLAGVDPGELAAATRELVGAEQPAFGRLGTLLAERWPGRDPLALAQTGRALVPLVQLPPRGVWGRGGRAVHATAESWLGGPLDGDPAPDGLVLRYLAAFGPATVADVQNWSGLSRLAEVADRLRPRLRVDRAADGRELLDLPDAPRPADDVPAPVRFLPQYDNVLLGHADRSRIAPAGAAALSDEQHHWAPALVDGMLRATWRRDGGVLHVRAPGATPAERADLEAEGAALLGLLAPKESPDVRVTPA